MVVTIVRVPTDINGVRLMLTLLTTTSSLLTIAIGVLEF
jgi:hypothetical protein